jgi:hypothetical protein
MKKTSALLLALLVCIVLSACSKENENNDDIVSQEQWLNVADSSSSEIDVLEELDVFLVEPAKSVDQVASYDEFYCMQNNT